MGSTLLQLRGVSKSFGAVRALRCVSFSLAAGEVHALLGENGAGKSTLIKIITGAHEPDNGSIEFAGRPVSRLSPASAHALGIAAIYQQPALFPDLSVAENIAIALEPPEFFGRARWAERRRQARELLSRVGARIDPDTEVRALSMPEQQLVEIARSLGTGARVLIMDEPTASLTESEVRLLFNVIGELRGQGVGVIYISHRLSEIFTVADRVTVLRDGESVGSHAVADIDERQLIRLMVGREIAGTFPRGVGSAGEPVLSLRSVSQRATGVHDVTLEVRSGEIVGLAGLVGAGRTELARVLFGIDPADGGEMRIGGQLVHIRSPRQAIELGIGYVPEDRRRHGVILEMPIAANVTMPIHAKLFPWSCLRFGRERDFVATYMRDLGIKAPSSDSCGFALSGGNQQKVALARWLATRPKLLVLDEPTQGVDVGAKTEIHKQIRSLADEGLAVLLISSDLTEVLGLSDRVAVMRGGTVVATFDGAEVTPDAVMAAALGQPADRGAA